MIKSGNIDVCDKKTIVSILSNWCITGTKHPMSMQPLLPLENEENIKLTYFLKKLISLVENDIDNEKTCADIISFIKSTEAYKKHNIVSDA